MTAGWYEKRFEPYPTKVRVECAECGRPMWLPKSKVEMYRRCGPACSAAARRGIRAERTRACDTCGASFTPRPRQLALGQGRFCSQACNTAGQDAVNQPGAQALARTNRAKAIAEGRARLCRGPAHPRWKGGYEAMKERRRAKFDPAKLREYRRKNPHKIREWAGRRGGRKLGRLAYGTIPRLGAAQRWRCAICRAGIKRGYHVDHITPLARGGEHEAANIQLLCATCNVRKNAKDPIDYMRSLGRLL